MDSDKASDRASGLYWLCKEAEHRSSSAVNSPAPEPPPQVPDPVVPPAVAAVAEKRRRGRPPRARIVDSEMPDLQVVGEKRRRGRPGKGPMAKRRRKKGKEKDDEDGEEVEHEDEDVCFICFDGGSLVVCDREDCPKAYHPACIKRDEAFFRSKARWTCGWHICSRCQTSASRYMCYTCPYSICKGCINNADYLCVRGNKGLCLTCYKVILMIENIDQGNQDTVKVDFDDKLSWEYLFKMYWICLKRDLSLTVDEITHAQKLSPAPTTRVTRRVKSYAVDHHLGNHGALTRENPPVLPNQESKSICDNNSNHTSVITSGAWASKKLLDFVAYMRNGDTSALSQKEVQVLLFDYIKRENLRDPHQRSEIVCDPRLENLFGKRRVRHFEMLSLLEFHYLIKDDPVVKLVRGDSKNDNLPIINASDSHIVGGKDGERLDVKAGNEGEDASWRLENHVNSSGSSNNVPNNQACLRSESISGAKSETSVASLSTGSTPSANVREANNSWLYRDPKGKVQGPFGIEQFQKWSLTGIFQPDIRIWRSNTEESESFLLGDVIKNQILLQNNLSQSPPEVKGASDITSHHCDEPCSDKANCVGMDTEAHSDGKLVFAKGNGPVPHSSILKTPDINSDPLIYDAQTDSSSKSRDPVPDPPQVIKSCPDQLQVHSVEQVSTFTEKKHSVQENSSCVGQKLKSSPNRKTRNSQKKMETQVKGSRSQENQTNKQCNVGQPSSDGPVCENSSLTEKSSHEFHSQGAHIANLTDSPEENFTINLQEFPVPVPKTSNVDMPAMTTKEQSCQENQISEKDFVGQPSSDVPLCQNSSVNNLNSKESHPHYKTKANLMESSAQKFFIDLQDFPMRMSEANTVDLAAQTSTEQRQQLKQLNEQQYMSWDSSNGPPQPSSVNLDSHVTTTGELPAQTIDDQRYIGQPSSDGPLGHKGSVNNLNSQESHPHCTSSANLPGSLEQRFDINVQEFPMPEASTEASPAQAIEEQQWEPPRVSAQNLSVEDVPNLTSKSFDQDKQRCFGQSSSDVPRLYDSSVSNLNSHYASMANINGSSEQNSSKNLQDFSMLMRKTSTLELPSQSMKEQPWEPAPVSAQNLSIPNMLSLSPKSIDRNEKYNFRDQNNVETQVSENDLSLSQNFSRSNASDLVLGGGADASSKGAPIWDDMDWSFFPGSSFNANEIENDQMTTQTSKCDKLPPPSPPNPLPNASSWLAMVTGSLDPLAEKSVSDLLAEVDAMESNSDQASPNPLMDYRDDDYGDDLFHDFRTSENLMLPPTMKEDPSHVQDNTVFEPFGEPRKHSNTSSVLEMDVFTSKDDMSSSGNVASPPQSIIKDDPIQANKDTIFEPSKKPHKYSNTNPFFDIDAFFSDADLISSENLIQPSQSAKSEEQIRAPCNPVPKPIKKHKKYSSTSSKLEVESFDINASPPKRTRDLADIMNAPKKHDSKSGSARRDSGQGTPKGSGSKIRTSSSGIAGKESHQKHGGERFTSPRERNPSTGLTSPGDRNMPGGEAGSTNGRPSWSMQSSFGGGSGGSGGHSRSNPRGRVCKFYENGYCRKGAFCEYLHP